MNQLLQDKWQNGQPPFHGFTISPKDCLSLAELQTLLAVIFKILQPIHINYNLFILKDWHAHDGYLTQATSITWQELNTILLSDEAIEQHISLEQDVSIGIYADCMNFYLRYSLIEEESHQFGDFDFSADEFLINTFLQSLSSDISALLMKESAKGFFDRTYAG
jgi:hypothetical protein